MNGNVVVSWTVTSNGFPATFTLDDSSGPQGSGSLNSGDGFSVSGSFIPTSTSPDTVTANITWSDGFVGGEPSPVSVTLPTNCAPSGVCTYTKGFYRNHPDVTASIIGAGTVQVGNVALNAGQAQQVLDATPGKPGKVTFTSNDLLNLAQQLITAELNVVRGSTPAPTSAIAAANAAITATTNGGGVQLSASGDVGSLITPLDNFNSSDDCG
jgi:hypothetical protein